MRSVATLVCMTIGTAACNESPTIGPDPASRVAQVQVGQVAPPGPPGGCCGPVQVSGPLNVITAEYDPAQRVAGATVFSNVWTPVEGPLFVTDLINTGGSFVLVYLVPGDECSTPETTGTLVWYENFGQKSTGMRLFVPEGSSLCLGGQGTAFYSGFRPY